MQTFDSLWRRLLVSEQRTLLISCLCSLVQLWSDTNRASGTAPGHRVACCVELQGNAMQLPVQLQ